MGSNKDAYSPEWISRQEAAESLGVDTGTVDRLIATGALPRYRLRGRYIRLRATDVAELALLPTEWLDGC